MKSSITFYKEDTTLSFMNERNQEVEGEIHEVNISINKYQRNIIYTVLYLGTLVEVDGETYRVIKQ